MRARPASRPRSTGAARVPVSRRFDDPYFSLDDGVAESVHVFLGGNGLPQAFRPGMRIAELGFGTGLNCAVALLAWRAAGQAGPLRYTGFEACPMEPGDIARALGGFAATAPLAEAMARPSPGTKRR